MRRILQFDDQSELTPVRDLALFHNKDVATVDTGNDLSHITDQILFRYYDLIRNGELTEAEILSLIEEFSEIEGLSLQPSEIERIKREILEEESPFGILEPLVNREDISDIIVAGWDKIYAISDRKIVPVSIQFPSHSKYKTFVDKLLYRAGTFCNTKKPIADGAIKNVRINCIHESLSQGGPYLTLRISRFSSVSLKQLEEKALAQAQILEYLKCLVLIQKTVLIAGEVGTGKTTLLRALANCIPHAENIVVIEDTPEIKLDHPCTRYLLTREANTENIGEINQSQCVWAGMRMGMNRIILGEIRDAKAAEAFIDVCASGHSGLSTIHAKSAQEALSRLCLFLSRAQKFTDEQTHMRQIALAVGA
ncbi:MAG: ATPase, T2SS/T4P/T4SS family, partial [Deltaproteobacteria bacterium]|nr:ATPase, T2SS/T4P/T4SS family [Deltaproteobacteria bacterium]